MDAFRTAGATPEMQSKWAPLYINEFWTGQYSNSNPLREGAVPFLYQKFYSGSRFETIRSGSNVEISSRLTIFRRPGNSVYNSQTFNRPLTFYSFRVYNGKTRTESIVVLVDTVTGVYNGTGPNTKILLRTKSAGAGQTDFQSVGNTLYAGDGVSTWKWVWAPAWAANTTYNAGDFILDNNGNIQQCQGQGAPIFSTANNTGNSLVVETSTASVFDFVVGDEAFLNGLTANPSLNGQTITLDTVFNNVHGQIVSAPYTANIYSTLLDTGVMTVTGATSGLSGSSQPSFPTSPGAATADNTIAWVCKGPSVQDWGIVAPTTAPAVSNVLVPSGNSWAASTFYWPSLPVLLDPNGNIQQLTTAGTTHSSVPTFNGSGTTADGTAVWTFLNSGTRAISHAYTVGQVIAVTVVTTTTITIPTGGGRGSQQEEGITATETITITTTNYFFFECTTAGTSSATATTSVKWASAVGGTNTDGGVTWTNLGYQVKRSTTTASPTSNAAGAIGNSTAITTVNNIDDAAGSGGGSGFQQNVHVAGISGASHPTWAVTGTPSAEAAGLITHESGGLTWLNNGPVSSANTGTWVYGYSYKNSVTGHESTLSPLSAGILLAANSGIAVSGPGDPNYATDGVDTVNLYRSEQGQQVPFLLQNITAPPLGATWNFIDTTPDQPNPGAVINPFIEADTTGNNAPPPVGLNNLTYYFDRVIGSVGEFLNYSGQATQQVGVGAESFPGNNFFQMPAIVTASWPNSTGLLIFTVHGFYFSTGTDLLGNPAVPTRILEDVGLSSTNMLAINGSLPCIWTTDAQLLTLDPSTGVSRLSDPVADTANGIGAFSTTSSYLTWHTNGEDQGYYIGDSTTGWFRLAPTSAPESGFTWSPKANLVNGCGCIKSIETVPGFKQMLVGASNSGPILYRDLTTNTDNGTAYTASLVFGCIVFAQPNECAEIESITTECVAIGSHPTVGIWGDEIAPVGSPDLLTLPVNDPPFLATPTTVYSDRWYFSTLGAPAWMRYMLLSISWPAENFANELLAYAFFGCIHMEK